jgi:ABC-type ATPase involved in cell division
VGESGAASRPWPAASCACSTTGGRITFDGRDITNIKGGDLFKVRREMMMVFRTLRVAEPRKRVSDRGRGAGGAQMGTSAEINARCRDLLEVVGLNPEH